MKNIKKWYLKYFDWNDDGITNWWEFLIPFSLILLIETIAELFTQVILWIFG
jgi:hypothetical protein